MRLFKKGQFYYYEEGTDLIAVPEGHIGFKEKQDGTIVIGIEELAGSLKRINTPKDELFDQLGNQHGENLVEILTSLNTGTDVNQSDQATPAVIQKFNHVTNSTTLAAPALINTRTVTLTSTTGVYDGSGVEPASHIVIFSPTEIRFSSYTVTNLTGNVATLDSLLDFSFPSGSFVDVAYTNMNVDGSTTPVVFGIRGINQPEGVKLTYDLTRIIIGCKTDTSVDLAKFGDLPKLTNGLLLRTVNGDTFNIFNAKSNREIGNLMYDYTPFDSQNAVQGQHGFVSRMTFAGQSKIGVVLRLPIGWDAQIIVQDDLTLLDTFEVMSEGHLTSDSIFGVIQ
jgi:hypothetical protein